MSFSIDLIGGVTVLELPRELTLGNREALKRVFHERLDAGDRRFVLDFARTGFVDSSGLGVLVGLSKTVRERRGELRLAGLNEELRTMFGLTQLDTLFQISDSRATAVGEL